MTTPKCTYRLQFRPDFGFDEATAVAGYLSKLGVSHIYASPYLQAAPGSTHGYDVVNHSEVNVELGGAQAHQRFSAELSRLGMGQILDIVPNHMAIPGRCNAWWWDVLKHGPRSRFASYFDIDWQPPEDKLRNTVLMPVLGNHYGIALEERQLFVEKHENDWVVRYFDNEFPLDPATVPPIEDENDVAELNADIDRLDDLLNAQHYRLAYWRVAGEELDYRRFFDINSLVALRAEEAEVFEATHGKVVEWLQNGILDGVRVDHIDGLRDPVKYLQRLRAAAGKDAWIVVEKITESGERIPATWPIAGTTGYEWLSRIDGLFVDPNAEDALNEIYRNFSGVTSIWDSIVRDGKSYAANTLLTSDVDRLTKTFVALCQEQRRYRDYTRSELRGALVAMLICLPVYRSYVSAEANQVTSADREVVSRGVEAASVMAPDLDLELLEFLGRVLTLEVGGSLAGGLAMRFQQLSGPIMAKGVEDTAFYRYFRLASRNEVGADPGELSVRPDDFHEAAAENQRLWPTSMVSSTTHDTKRSEDVRHRINVLSEMPKEWAEAVERWASMNNHLRRNWSDHDGFSQMFPDRNVEYLIYQTLVGAFPISAQRLSEYVSKAVKEAKLHTTWTEPNAAYDEALLGFVEGICTNGEFLEDLRRFLEPVIPAGRSNSLAATAVKMTMPGIPDIYQGCELWDLSLVDPDNRRDVDFETREKLLDALADMPLDDIVAGMDEGLPKLHLLQEALRLRTRCPEAFSADGFYESVSTTGLRAANVFAFCRGEQVVTVVPRLTISVAGEWGDTSISLPEGEWRNIFGSEAFSGPVPIENLFTPFPVAILERV